MEITDVAKNITLTKQSDRIRVFGKSTVTIGPVNDFLSPLMPVSWTSDTNADHGMEIGSYLLGPAKVRFNDVLTVEVDYNEMGLRDPIIFESFTITDNPAVISLVIDWGDGGFLETFPKAELEGFLTHTYEAPGDYEIDISAKIDPEAYGIGFVGMMADPTVKIFFRARNV